MPDLINLTQARSNLSQLIDSVWTEKKKFILIRDSIPQAVVIPYTEYQLQQETWQQRVDDLMIEGKKYFKKWLKQRKMKWPSSPEEVYEIVDEVAGRN